MDPVLDSGCENVPSETIQNVTKVENDTIDVFDNGKIVKKVIKKSNKSSTNIGVQNIVKVNLTGAITSTRKIIDIREEYEFVTGHGEVILGIDIAVALMKVGETSQVSIDPSYGFRDINWYSCPLEENTEAIHIPPNSHLTYLIEVLSFEPYPESTHDATDYEIDRIIHFCDKKRLWGNMWYTYGDYTTSGHVYQLAFNILHKLNYDAIERVKKLYIIIGNNLSITKMKMDQHSDVIKILNYIVKNEPNNTKAIYRLAQCFFKVGLLDECHEFLIKCRNAGTTNELIEKFYLKVHDKVVLENRKQSESYSRIFQSKHSSNSFTSSTFHTFTTPQSTINTTINSIIDKTEKEIPDTSNISEPESVTSPSQTNQLLRMSIIVGSILFLGLSYFIFN